MKIGYYRYQIKKRTGAKMLSPPPHLPHTAAGIKFSSDKHGHELGADDWGQSAHIDLFDCDLAKMQDPHYIAGFCAELCDLINMKRFGEPVIVRFGDTPEVCGITLVQLIMTSDITAHFVDTSRAIYLCCFSCKGFDPKVLAEFTKAAFGCTGGYNGVIIPRKKKLMRPDVQIWNG